MLEKEWEIEISHWVERGELSLRLPRLSMLAQCRLSNDRRLTRRSSSELDYTTFGELNVLIGENWAIFGGSLSSRSAVNKVMASLNSLRGPVAHCSPLAEDEVLRLQLAVRDWFRLME